MLIFWDFLRKILFSWGIKQEQSTSVFFPESVLIDLASKAPQPRVPSSVQPQPLPNDLSFSQTHHCIQLRRRVFAVATFDANGILERSEIRRDRQELDWTPAIFSAIGCKRLLDAALNHQTFRYAKVSGEDHVAFLVRRRHRYIALLAEPIHSWEEETEIRDSLRSLRIVDLLAMMRS